MNPSLAYGLTFYCPGFTFTEYAVVYWLGSLTGKLHYNEKHMSQFFKSEHTVYSECLFSRNDSGSSLVHGPYSKDFCQEPTIFSEDTFQSAKGGQRRKEENVKETTHFHFLLNQPFRKVPANKWDFYLK